MLNKADSEAFASKVTQQLSELPSFFFGLARSRFIEKNKRRLDHEGTGQFDDSCLSGRNLANFAIGDIAQPDQADDAIGFGIDVHLRSPKAPAVTDFAGNTNVVAHRERRKQFEALKRAGKTHTSALMRWFLGDIFVIKDDLPTSEWLKPSDRVEQRGLTRTVGANEPGDTSGFDRNRNIVKRNVSAETNFDANSFKQRHLPAPLAGWSNSGSQCHQDSAPDP